MPPAIDDLVRLVAAIGGPAGLWTAFRAFRKSRHDDQLDELDVVTRVRQIAADELDRSQRDIAEVRDDAKRQIAEVRDDARRQIADLIAYYEQRETRLVAGVLAGLYPPFTGSPYAATEAAVTAARTASEGGST